MEETPEIIRAKVSSEYEENQTRGDSMLAHIQSGALCSSNRTLPTCARGSPEDVNARVKTPLVAVGVHLKVMQETPSELHCGVPPGIWTLCGKDGQGRNLGNEENKQGPRRKRESALLF